MLQWHFLFNPRMEEWVYYKWRAVLEARAESWAPGQFKYRCRPHRVIHLAADGGPVGGEPFPWLTRQILAKKGVMKNTSAFI